MPIKDDKLSGLLGMATRAKKVLFGESAYESLTTPSSSLLLISDAASKRTMKQLVNRANYYQKEYLVIADSILNQATGNTTKKYCVITSEGFSEGILDICRKR